MAMYQYKITQVYRYPACLPDREDDILSIKRGIYKKDYAAQYAKVPKRYGDDALLFPLGMQPLDKKPHKEKELPQKTENDPVIHI